MVTCNAKLAEKKTEEVTEKRADLPQSMRYKRAHNSINSHRLCEQRNNRNREQYTVKFFVSFFGASVFFKRPKIEATIKRKGNRFDEKCISDMRARSDEYCDCQWAGRVFKISSHRQQFCLSFCCCRASQRCWCIVTAAYILYLFLHFSLSRFTFFVRSKLPYSRQLEAATVFFSVASSLIHFVFRSCIYFFIYTFPFVFCSLLVDIVVGSSIECDAGAQFI